MDQLEKAEDSFDEALNNLLVATAKEAYKEGVEDAICEIYDSPGIVSEAQVRSELLGDDPENILGRNETGV